MCQCWCYRLGHFCDCSLLLCGCNCVCVILWMFFSGLLILSEDIAVHPTCLLSLIGLFVRTSNDFAMVSGERNIIPESTPASSFFITSPVSALRTQKDN